MNNAAEIKQGLLKAMKNNLPGNKSHLKMIPESRLNNPEYDKKNVKKSAVLLLLFPENETYNIFFIKRTEDNGSHSGQIAFPGGKFEKTDNNLENTSLRETEEEIGIKKEDIRIIKELSPLFIPVSKFLVYPFVGIIDYNPKITINSDEVQEIFSLDFQKIITAKPVEKTFEVRNQKITAPFYIFKEFEIWGASAMILSEFIDLIKNEFV